MAWQYLLRRSWLALGLRRHYGVIDCPAVIKEKPIPGDCRISLTSIFTSKQMINEKFRAQGMLL